MPITKQAIKKLATDRKREKRYEVQKKAMYMLVRRFRKTPTKKSLDKTFSVIDKAAKSHTIHPNKAARLKSRLAKLLAKKK